MARRLFIVENCWTIKGRGVVPEPALVPIGDELFRVGDPVLLKRPDGTTLLSRIGALMIFTIPPRIGDEAPILLPDLRKEDVTVGTEIWSVDPDRMQT